MQTSLKDFLHPPQKGRVQIAEIQYLLNFKGLLPTVPNMRPFLRFHLILGLPLRFFHTSSACFYLCA